MSQQDKALTALQNGHHALLLTGNLFDLHVEDNSLYYRPLYLAEKLFEKDIFVLRYSRSSGLTIHRYNETKTSIKKILDKALQLTGLNKFIGNKEFTSTEVVEIFRGFKKISCKQWENPFAIIIDFLPHLSSHSEERELQIVSESISDIANLPAVVKAGNSLICYAYEDSELSSLLNVMTKIEYSYPCIDEYQQFFSILADRPYEYAATSLTAKEAGLMARGLKLTQLASLFREYKSKGLQITRKEIILEKEDLIEKISESTLTVLNTELSFDDMAGLDVPKKILKDFSEKLKNQDPSSPRALLFAGPPGTGKTTIASAFANSCGFNLVELSDSIKSQWVGQSEARLSLALRLIESLAPVMLFIDEIDQTFQNRTNSAMDGGVSSHYLKTIFKFAARDEIRGKICIIGCSNNPQSLDPALISRFTTIPLLEATPKEMAAIFPKIQKRIMGVETIDPTNASLLQGCEILFSKGASPRQIFDIINRTISVYSANFNEENIYDSCLAYRGNGDMISGAFSSLSAIRLTAFSDYLPWAGDSSYTFPWYLEGIVNKQDGSINELELSRKLTEFRQQSKY